MWLVLPQCCLDLQLQDLHNPEGCNKMSAVKSMHHMQISNGVEHGEITTCLSKSKHIPAHCPPTTRACQIYPPMRSCHFRPCWPVAVDEQPSLAGARTTGWPLSGCYAARDVTYGHLSMPVVRAAQRTQGGVASPFSSGDITSKCTGRPKGDLTVALA